MADDKSIGSTTQSIAVSALRAQQARMRIIAENLANSNSTARTAKPKWNPEFNEVKVPVVAEWQGLKMSAGEITRLKAGDLLMLDPACAANVQILLNQIPKFIGRSGTCAGKWAVQLTAAINNNQPT